MQSSAVGQAAKKLGWTESPGFFDAGRFDALPHNELRYACRKAVATSGLQGVYLLCDSEKRNHIPIAFLCTAETEEEARVIHRRVWNLNLVPFVIIESPTRIRIYQGFKFDAESLTHTAFVEARLANTAELLERLAAFRSESIDDGRVFETWGHLVAPKSRVDEHLLQQLQKLDGLLRKMELPRDPAHCLIGKYVWLSYLRARGILSDWRLEKYGVKAEDIFSRDAKLTVFHRLDDELQEWLNGEIFPLRGEDRRAVKSEHLQMVASVFAGDDVNGQLCLFNEFYDFSHIPIETLSVVYEQFLHHKEEGDERSEGEESGAYYTPVCLADFMIAEMDHKVPLRDGVAVFDPSCGSGAFLVQAYRRLVERTMQEKGRDLRLKELKDLLEDNIFGVDRDPDACRVARMSLAIALLDYANPPDVSGPAASFKLPTLGDNNVLQKDFFDLDPAWPRAKDRKAPQWIVGNPPWVELKSSKRAKDKRNKPAWAWLDKNAAKKKDALPVSGNQMAEMFAWRVLDFSRDDSVIGLVMPAMTLFKHEAKPFRQGFFGKLGVWSVANFANLAYVLFARRVDVPAACFFYRPSRDTASSALLAYAPFVVEQRANSPAKSDNRLDTWNILVRSTDYREISLDVASKGDRLTWKLAMWGGHRDERLLRRMQSWPTLAVWCEKVGLEISEGPHLRSNAAGRYPLEKSLVGLQRIALARLKGVTALFTIPDDCYTEPLNESDCYVRWEGNLKICKAPHLLVDRGRRFATYSDKDFIIPPPQLGLHGDDPAILKALALYLISPIARWHQFLTSSQWGIWASIAGLADLRSLPVPPSVFDSETATRLASVYDSLAKRASFFQLSAFEPDLGVINELLDLRPSDQDLVSGFFDGPYQCIKGKFPMDAFQLAQLKDIERYCLVLQRELDAYTSNSHYKHQLHAVLDARQVWITISGSESRTPFDPMIADASNTQSDFLSRIGRALRRKHSQWMYFEKAVYIFENGKLHFIKPRRRIEWNVRQAVLDADDIIAETLTNDEAE